MKDEKELLQQLDDIAKQLKGIREEYELEGGILNENYSECDI